MNLLKKIAVILFVSIYLSSESQAVFVSHEDIQDGLFTKRKININWNYNNTSIDEDAKKTVRENIKTYWTTCHFFNFTEESLHQIKNFVLELARTTLEGVTFDPPQVELSREFKEEKKRGTSSNYRNYDDAFLEAYPDTRSKEEKNRNEAVHNFGKTNNFIPKDDGSDQSN